MKSLLLILLVLLLPATISASSDSIKKETMISGGKSRTYYLFVPKNIKPSSPLIITLHGSGRDGRSLVEKWKELADKEGIILAGPDAQNSQGWAIPEDGPDFLRDLVEALQQKYSINPRRVYLFGHSAGAVMAINMAMFESQYFAAVAVHAGAWRQPQQFELISYAKRKTPLTIIVGTNDQFFPLKDVRATRDALNAHGFAVELTEIDKHTHWYYDLAPKINEQAWNFLKKRELAEAPHYEQYQFAQP